MREVQISGASANVTRTPQTGEFGAMDKVGKELVKIGDKVLAAGTMSSKAKSAQSKAQSSREATKQNDAWKLRGAEQKGNFNEETSTQSIDKLYAEQQDYINNNKDFTDETRTNLLANLDHNRSNAKVDFLGNQSNARMRSAVNNATDEIDYHIQNQNMDEVERVVDLNIDSGAFDPSLREGLLNQAQTGVDFNGVMEDVDDITNGIQTLEDFNYIMNMGADESEIEGDQPVVIEARSRTEALQQVAVAVGDNPEFSNEQQTAIKSSINRNIKAIATEQSSYLKTLDVMFLTDRVTQENIYSIDNPDLQSIYQEKFNNQVIRLSGDGSAIEADDKHLGKMVASTIGRYNFDEAQAHVDGIQDEGVKQEQQSILDTAKFKYDLDVTGAGGKLSASTTKQKYTEWVPQFSNKKGKDFKIEQGEMYSGIQTTMNLLKTSGASYSIKDIVKDEKHPRVISGKEAIGEVSHYINQLPNGKQRDDMVKDLNTILDDNPQFNWEIDTTNNINIKPELIKPFEDINNTFDIGDGLSVTQRNGVYNDAIAYITSMYNVDPIGFQKNKDTIIKTALKPYNKIRSDLSFDSSLKQTTGVTGNTNTNTTAVIDFSTLK